MRPLVSVFRRDATNVGDWWSPPHKYFDLNPVREIDLKSHEFDLPDEAVVIVGGGGLGREDFRQDMSRLCEAAKSKGCKLVAWGVGADLPHWDFHKPVKGMFLLADYFVGFDLVGTRVWDPAEAEKWVPCASAMHTGFDKLREVKPDLDVVLYAHKRRKICKRGIGNFWKKNRQFLLLPPSLAIGSEDNSGNDIYSKLELMARARVVITNSYHGVYWATLLGRQVICLPFKSGLYSFRHEPAYKLGNVTLDDLHAAPAYPDALEECRRANIHFQEKLQNLMM